MILDNYLDNSFYEDIFNFDRSARTRSQSRKIRNKESTNKVTKSLQPRKLLENNDINSLLLTNLTNAPWMNLDNIGTRISRNFNEFSISEEKDRYLVSYKDKNIKNKEFEVNYLKNKQELQVSSRLKAVNKQKNGKYICSTSSKNCITLEKPVKYDDIKVQVKEDGLKITVPKLNSENASRFAIEDAENNEKKTQYEHDESNENDKEDNVNNVNDENDEMDR